MDETLPIYHIIGKMMTYLWSNKINKNLISFPFFLSSSFLVNLWTPLLPLPSELVHSLGLLLVSYMLFSCKLWCAPRYDYFFPNKFKNTHARYIHTRGKSKDMPLLATTMNNTLTTLNIHCILQFSFFIHGCLKIVPMT
jgi:hypothetical protein